MLKRIVILIFILSALVMLAMAPMNRNTAPENTQRLQVTVEVTAGVVVTDATPAPVAGSGLPMSTMIIFGLLLLLGVAIVVGGIALVSRRQ